MDMARPLSFVFLLALCHPSISQSNVTITTSKGAIVGLSWDPNPRSLASYDAFIGIPYGQIPARFQTAVPRSSWSSPLLTQSDGPACPQPGPQPYSEDCLYLNVYTPLGASSTPGKLPVVAYIHGSGFTVSSSSSAFYGPDFLVPQGVILVTMNYRLGAAGFLTLGSPLAPGNLGLLDTQLALSWIQKEISVFGGDPNKVTLAGQSAGAVMTMFHYLSNVSSSMFHRAIALSGSAMSTWGHVSADEAVRRAKQLANDIGCNPALNDSQILACLQSHDINNIVNHQNITLPTETLASGNVWIFTPVIDTSFGKPPFFSDSIENLVSKVAHKQPLITGFTTEEGIFLFAYDTWKLVESNLKGYVPLRLQDSLSDKQKSALGEKIETQYFPKTVDQNNILDIIKLYTDFSFAHPAIDIINHVYANATYGYVFAYSGSWISRSWMSFMSKLHVTGVTHGSDTVYIFYNGQDLSNCTSNQLNLAVKDNMIQLWTSFIKNGIPDVSVAWKPVQDSKQYLLIDTDLSLVNSSVVEESHYNFWANLSSSALSGSELTAVMNSLLLCTAVFLIQLKYNM